MMNYPRLYKQAFAVVLDLFCLPLIFCIAVWLRADAISSSALQPYLAVIVATPLVSIPVFASLGLYRAIIRFIGQKFVYLIFLGVTVSISLLLALALLGGVMVHLSPGVFGTYAMSAIVYLTASRFLARRYFGALGAAGRNVPVAIYGAGNSGSRLARALSGAGEYQPVAFIDDNTDLHGAVIGGIKVYGPAALPAMIASHDIAEVLLAMPALSKARQRRILDRLEPLNVKTLVTPPIKSLVSGLAKVEDVREVEIEDLLGRDAVEPDQTLLAKCITGKNVMVSGAGGSIGSELCRQILRQLPKRLVLLEMSEFALYAIEQELQAIRKTMVAEVEVLPFLGSVLETEKCEKIMRNFRVDTVYHAAAYKHVPLVEHNPIQGIRNNAFGTLSMAHAAMRAGVQCFVLISTDKAVRPTNVMGASKRLSELVLQAFARKQTGTRFCMVRFGNVLGSSGSVVPLFRKQIAAGGPVTITHPEITRYFMTIPEAAQLVLQAGAMGEGGDVFVLDMGEPVKIIDLARRMVHLSGKEVKNDATPDGSIEIHFVGLRPGEKLYEELLIGDNVEGTEHPLIMRAQEAEIAWPVLEAMLQQLEQGCNSFDYEGVRELLLKMVAGYTPQCGIEDLVWHAERTVRANRRSTDLPSAAAPTAA